MMALFLSTFSLPNDIKTRTIYTIVTKPVRPLEIVLGRVIGFTIVGSLMLIAMCGISYMFVIRGLDHRHEVDEIARITETPAEGSVVWSGTTTIDDHHRHQIRVFQDGLGETDQVMGHKHRVRRLGEGDGAEYEISAPEGMLQARVPHYGYLRFLDRSGQVGEGINVGYEWGYRGYIEGGTLSAAIWLFENVTPERYPEGLDLDLNLRVLRSYMGDIERGILGSITIKNPNPSARLDGEPIPFVAREFAIDRHFIPRSLKAIDKNDGSVHDVDLFEDLTDDGRVEIWIQCSEQGQYFGMADPDVYILDADGQFWLNFIKGFVGIWLQMLLVNTFGIMFSTFLNGAVSMLATLATIAIALFRGFIIGLFSGELQGGGPVEATIRVLKQANLTLELEIGSISMFIVQSIDIAFLSFLRALASFLPDYFRFSTAEFVASGYNISSNLLAQHVLITLGYVLVVSMVAYFFLKTRELAA
jgi:hypothetical protein